jgi:hypothetical protein
MALAIGMAQLQPIGGYSTIYTECNVDKTVVKKNVEKASLYKSSL